MNTWFECKVKFDREIENAEIKSVTEPYLVDALSFTEAEARIIKETAPFATGEFTVTAVNKRKIGEMVYDENGDRWYRCKINYITVDEKKGMEKKTAEIIMVQAIDFSTALTNLKNSLTDTLGDYEIAQINETLIMDVFEYTPEPEEKNPIEA